MDFIARLNLIFEDWQGDLQNLSKADQDIRKKYRPYLERAKERGMDWREAATQWRKEFDIQGESIFGDESRLPIAREIIKANIDEIAASDELMGHAWPLVQHMEDDIEFQEWFLKYVKTGTEDYKYMVDRILVNRGQKQKYGTQDV